MEIKWNQIKSNQMKQIQDWEFNWAYLLNLNSILKFKEVELKWN